MLGLWERRHDAAGTFSKGMRQKLAIARALLHEPRVLFLDEPTAGLDPEAAKLVRDFIAELKSEGRTIFLCTHNLDEADRLCDRIAVFKTHLRVVDSPAGLRKELYGRQVVFHLAEPAEPYSSLIQNFHISNVSRPSIINSFWPWTTRKNKTPNLLENLFRLVPIVKLSVSCATHWKIFIYSW